MDLAGKVVVVTGAASGIGRALALRFVAEGSMGVVIADRDAAGAAAVAARANAQRPAAALAVTCDVGDEDELERLIARTEAAFGPVDLFCANAGIAVGTDLQTPDDVWEAAFAVNVKAHIYAARRLLPGWLQRGEGYFLATASAAGLLTQIGSAPYAVSKHAAVALAEWLAVTYAHQGIKVSCLCPMGVNTAMLHGDLATEDGGVAVAAVLAAGAVLEPEEVANAVVEGIHAERFLILPHPEVLRFFQRKAGDYDRWLGSMNRLQARVSP